MIEENKEIKTEDKILNPQMIEIMILQTPNPIKLLVFTNLRSQRIATNAVIKAMQLAMTTPLEEMIAHASYLNIPSSDEMGLFRGESPARWIQLRFSVAA